MYVQANNTSWKILETIASCVLGMFGEIFKITEIKCLANFSTEQCTEDIETVF